MHQNQTKTWSNVSIDTLPRIASELTSLFSKPSFFAIQGEMGAGKTTFVQNLLRALGIEDPDGSPTYGLIHAYENGIGINIYHLDCYRIENERDIEQLGLEELFDEKAFFFVEWPDKIEKKIPEHANWLYIRCEPDSELREIVLNYDN